METGLLKDIIRILTNEQGLTNLPEEVAAFNSLIKKEESQISLTNTKNILDTLIIMANSDKLLQELSDLKVDIILEKVITKGSDELNTLILVVNS